MEYIKERGITCELSQENVYLTVVHIEGIIIYAFSFTYIYIRAKYRIGHRNKRKGYNLWGTCRSEKCQFNRYNNMYAYSYIYILRARYI